VVSPAASMIQISGFAINVSSWSITIIHNILGQDSFMLEWFWAGKDAVIGWHWLCLRLLCWIGHDEVIQWLLLSNRIPETFLPSRRDDDLQWLIFFRDWNYRPEHEVVGHLHHSCGWSVLVYQISNIKLVYHDVSTSFGHLFELVLEVAIATHVKSPQ
jgi:hypothetical protein